MKAIITKYISPTNTRGSRISAACDAKRKVYNWDYSIGVEENHRQAAHLLITELGWYGERYGQLVTGGLPNQGGYAHVMTGVQS